MVGFRTLLWVWFALMLLLAVTVGASFVTTGVASAGVSLGVALCKAALVFWFFMNLRAENGLIRIAALGAAVWLLVLLVLSAADYATRV